MIDAQARLSDAQAITATAASTNYYDTGSSADAGVGNPIVVNCSVTQAFNTLTSLAVDIQTDDNSSFSSPTTVFSTSVALAALTAGAVIELPAINGGLERYIRGNYTVTGTNPTTGTINLSLGNTVQNNVAAPDGIA